MNFGSGKGNAEESAKTLMWSWIGSDFGWTLKAVHVKKAIDKGVTGHAVSASLSGRLNRQAWLCVAPPGRPWKYEASNSLFPAGDTGHVEKSSRKER